MSRKLDDFYKGMLLLIAPRTMQPIEYFYAPKLGVAYCVNSKVANTAILRALLRVEEPGVEHPNPHDKSVKGRYVSSRRPEKAELVFSFVREPIERFKSFYRNKFLDYNEGEKFELHNYLFGRFHPDMSADMVAELACRIPDRIADVHFRSQSYTLRGLDDKTDFIGRIESMAEDWARLRSIVPGLPELGVANPSREASVQLSPKTLSDLRARYSDDYRRFYS